MRMRRFTVSIWVFLYLPWSSEVSAAPNVLCGGQMIDLSKDMCCSGNVFRGLAPLVALGFECCGNTVYDPNGSDLCCDTVLHLNAAANGEVCPDGSTEPPETTRPIGGLTGSEPPYSCNSNSTIVFPNPDPALYTKFLAVENEGMSIAVICTISGNATVIVISGCNTGNPITLHLSNRTFPHENSFGGISIRSYLLQCNQIGSEGVIRRAEDAIGVTLEVTTQDAITPSFTISSALRSVNHQGPIISSAKVGDLIYWTIDIPENYYGRPTCTAYSGTDDSGTPSIDIVDEGCTLDDSLVSGDFTNVDSDIPGAPLIKRLWTTVNAFQFYNSRDVFIECTVKICPNSISCEIGCGGIGKRSIRNDSAVDQLFTTWNRLHIDSYFDNGGNTNLGNVIMMIVAVVATKLSLRL